MERLRLALEAAQDAVAQERAHTKALTAEQASLHAKCEELARERQEADARWEIEMANLKEGHAGAIKVLKHELSQARGRTCPPCEGFYASLCASIACKCAHILTCGGFDVSFLKPTCSR